MEVRCHTAIDDGDWGKGEEDADDAVDGALERPTVDENGEAAETAEV
jgi:hypothetical protein